MELTKLKKFQIFQHPPPHFSHDDQYDYLEVVDDKTKIQSTLNPINITDEEFDKNISTKTMSNLILDRTYRPIIKVYVSMDKNGSTGSDKNSQIDASFLFLPIIRLKGLGI